MKALNKAFIDGKIFNVIEFNELNDIYVQYSIGDKISAYTVDHVYYGYTKESILPKEEFRQNELMKCIGVLLGVGIVTIAIMYWIKLIT